MAGCGNLAIGAKDILLITPDHSNDIGSAELVFLNEEDVADIGDEEA